MDKYCLMCVQFPASSLGALHRSTFLYAASHELLASYGESYPYQTHLYVCGQHGPTVLKEHMDLGEGSFLLLAGPHAVQLREHLLTYMKQRLSEIIFDADGFCQAVMSTADCEAKSNSTPLAA